MSGCPHPTSALYVDRIRGSTTCTLCGDVVTDQQYELDPVFSRGERSGGGRGGLRSLGSFRPTRGTLSSDAPLSRPSIDNARRGMLTIARELEISDDMVEMALGIYKLAVGVNAISGSRPAILCACLYAVCRRERTSHVVYDFAEISKESPSYIIGYMKMICEATHTPVPVVDPSCLVQRFADQLNLGDKTTSVVICALKVLRAMQDDWISCGRRPMGVCAAAILVACCVLGIPRSPEDVCGMVRLTAGTIVKRLTEFSLTPTAELDSIDSYHRSEATLPPAFNPSCTKTVEEDMNADVRMLASSYYELVSEAKVSAPATPERCAKWRRFIEQHCAMENIEPSAENLDLSQLSAEQQLSILGLPNTKPIDQVSASKSRRREEEKLLLKRESNSNEHSLEPTADFHRYLLQNSVSSSFMTQNSFAKSQQLNDPNQIKQLTDAFHQILKNEPEVYGLQRDFDFKETQNTQADFPASITSGQTGGRLSPAPMEPYSNDGTAAQNEFPLSSDPSANESMQLALKEILFDPERRYALPWEFVVLQDPETEDIADIAPYLVMDNEERIQRKKVGEAMYKDKWARGRARTLEEIEQLEMGRALKRRRRQPIIEHASVPDALERALRGRGAAVVNVSQIEELIPGLTSDDPAFDDDWLNE